MEFIEKGEGTSSGQMIFFAKTMAFVIVRFNDSLSPEYQSERCFRSLLMFSNAVSIDLIDLYSAIISAEDDSTRSLNYCIDVIYV